VGVEEGYVGISVHKYHSHASFTATSSDFRLSTHASLNSPASVMLPALTLKHCISYPTLLSCLASARRTLHGPVQLVQTHQITSDTIMLRTINLHSSCVLPSRGIFMHDQHMHTSTRLCTCIVHQDPVRSLHSNASKHHRF
jgi:hypothetical protein